MNHSLTRVVLPLGALLALVGGIAYVTQNLPNYRSPRPRDGVPAKGLDHDNRDLLQFTHLRASWDKEDANFRSDEQKYVLEYEKGVAGTYVFPFRDAEHNLELGVQRSHCDCAQIDLALLSDPEEWQRIDTLQKNQPGAAITFNREPAWTPLALNQTKGVAIPTGARGVVRISWKGRKSPGDELGLNIILWVQPQGQADKRTLTTLKVPVMMTPPMQFSPVKASLGTLFPDESRNTEFTIWSATRSSLDLDFPAKENHPLEITCKPGTAEQVQALRANIKKEIGLTTHIQCVYTVKVSAREPTMNLGSFYKPLLVHLDGFPLDGKPPVVEGMVKGDLDVGVPASKNKDKVQFDSFRARDGASREINLWTDPKIELAYHDKHPAALKVELTKVVKESTAARTKWLLEVTVPPNSCFGAFGDDYAVWLRLSGPKSRLVRIQVTGNAGS